MVDIGRALKIAESTGKVVFGVKESERAVKEGEAKLVIISNNCPSDFLASEHAVKVYRYSGSNVDLGALAGKPFSVSAVAVIDKGSSNILSLG